MQTDRYERREPTEAEEQERESMRIQVQERVEALLDDLPEGPFIQVIQNGGGHIDPMEIFTNREDAREYHRIRFNGVIEGHRRKLASHRQNWGGKITRSMRKIERPRVFCIVEERTGRVKYTNLLPSEEYRSDSESAFHNPTVWEKIDYHLPPFPGYIRDNEDQDARFAPDGYDGNQFQWHKEQVKSFQIRIQKPHLFENQYGDQ